MDFAIVLICAAAFGIRLIPTLVNGQYGNDAYYHVAVAGSSGRVGVLPDDDPGIVPIRRRTYPPLLHFLLSVLRGSNDRAALLLTSPIVDTATVALIYVFASSLGVGNPSWPAIIYALTPFNVLDGASLNPRPLANLLLCVAMVAVWWGVASGGSALLLGSAVLVLTVSESLVMLSNKLALQMLIPLHVMAAGYAASKTPALGFLVLSSIIIAVVLSNVLTRGRYLKVLLPDHIRYVRVHLAEGHYLTGKRSIQSPLLILKANPVATIGPFLGVALIVLGRPPEWVWLLLGWSIVVALMAQFWVWGDGWRYLQFGTFPSAILLAAGANALAGQEVADVLLVAVSLFLAAVTAVQMTRSLRRDQAPKVFRSLNSLPPEWRERIHGAKVYSNARLYSVAYATGASVLIGNPSAEGIRLNFALRELSGKPLKDVSEYARNELNLQLDYYLMFKWSPIPSTDGFDVVCDTPEVTVLEEESDSTPSPADTASLPSPFA